MKSLSGQSQSVIKNPLTVIAIFAGLAEVSATLALPQVSEDIQFVFVWFVMGFPILLVVLFFGTLWMKPKVLYAPSDFQDENNWMTSFAPPSSSKRAIEISAVDEEDIQPTPELKSTPHQVSSDEGSSLVPNAQQMRKQSRGDLAKLAEANVFEKLQSELEVYFRRDVSFTSAPNIRFDGVAERNGRPIFLEIVSVFNTSYANSVFLRLLEKVNISSGAVPQIRDSSVRFILVVVIHGDVSDLTTRELQMSFSEVVRNRGLGYEVRVYSSFSLRDGDKK